MRPMPSKVGACMYTMTMTAIPTTDAMVKMIS